MAGTRTFQQFGRLVILAGAVAPALHASFIWNTNIGSAIPASTFDSGSGVVGETLAFTFPFQGTNYSGNQLYISEAGFVWLGGYNVAENTSVTSSSNATMLFDQGAPRVAAAWYDLNPDLGGNIYFNQTSNEAIITWVQVPSDSSTSDPATFQMQLFASGQIIFSYGSLDNASLGSDPALMIGLTGNTAAGAAVAEDIGNLLATQTRVTLPANFYDYIPVTTTFSLVNQSVSFTPQGNGWTVDPVPEPTSFVPCAAALALLIFKRNRAVKD